MKTILIVLMILALATGLAGPAWAQSRTYIDITNNTLVLGRSAAGAGAGLFAGSVTITTAGVAVARVNVGAAITGAILQAGTTAGQIVTVINKGNDSITFAAKATSNVADGTSTVINTDTATMFVWDDASSLWFTLNRQ